MLAARETLRSTEQTVLLSAATAYINLLRDNAILDLQRRNKEVLEEQLRQTRLRMQSGNVTATDVSQAEARLNVARTQVFAAEANYEGSRALYREVIGLDAGKLSPASTIDRFAPAKITDAIAPRDRQSSDCCRGALQCRRRDPANQNFRRRALSHGQCRRIRAEELRNVTQPIRDVLGDHRRANDGSAVSRRLGVFATIRQAKETQGQKQIEFSLARDRARTAVVQAWAQVEAAKNSLGSSRAQVKAAEAALNGVREEARLGQRTTLDVLNAQQELVNARIAVVSAERDRVVNSYTLLAAMGGLTPQHIGLKVQVYDAQNSLQIGARCLDRRPHAGRAIGRGNRVLPLDGAAGRPEKAPPAPQNGPWSSRHRRVRRNAWPKRR